MRTFVYSDEATHKFWEIDLTGSSYVIRFGAVGGKGQTQTKTFANEASAQAAADRVVAQKLKAGYRETTMPAGPDALRRTLEDAINENPDDRAAHAAYADLLQEQGDPQGEFVQVQLALEDDSLTAKRRRELDNRQKGLLRTYRTTWAGEWVTTSETEGPSGRGQHDFPGPRPVRFIRGVPAEVTFGELTVECARAFVRSPQSRFVRRLFLGGFPYAEDESVLAELGRFPHFDNLRVFQFGWTSDEEYGDFCHFQCHLNGETIHNLIRRMTRLEELYLFADYVQLEILFRMKSLSNLRVFQLYHNWDHPLEMLARNAALSNLTHLLIHPKAIGAWSRSDVYLTNESVRALLKSKHLKSLTHLRLRLTKLGDAGIEEIIASGILKRLKMLDLRHGCVSDEGARLLATCPDVKNLDLLDLSRNELTEAGIAALEATGVRVLHQLQHGPSSDEEHPEYLMEGDYE